jgi:hypothetical protein
MCLEPTLIQESVATEEFDQLCFEFGIELDEDVSIRVWNVSCQPLMSISYVQTTEEVEEAIKKGLPTERPVSSLLPNRRLWANNISIATQN